MTKLWASKYGREKRGLRRLTWLQSSHSSKTEIKPIFLINKNVIIAGTKQTQTRRKFLMATVWKKLIFHPIFSKFLILFLNNNNNNYAMPEVGTIKGYILKAHTKFGVNRLNRLEKVVSRKTRLKFLFLFFFYTKFFFKVL